MSCSALRVRAAAGVVLCCVGLVACGSSGPKLPAATQVCRADLQAVRGHLSGATMTIVSRNPDDIVCRLNGAGTTVDVEAQASPRAWDQFDTTNSHYAQAFTVHQRSNQPQDLGGLGYSALWAPGVHQLVATNGTQSTGGSYVTVTLKGAGATGPSGLALAERVATATLKNAPRGPSPGPAPS